MPPYRRSSFDIGGSGRQINGPRAATIRSNKLDAGALSPAKMQKSLLFRMVLAHEAAKFTTPNVPDLQ
jgi:hypothetical protein